MLCRDGRGRTKVYAHEETLGLRVGKLLKVEDVVVGDGEDTSDGVDDAGLVRAREGENVFGHGCWR